MAIKIARGDSGQADSTGEREFQDEFGPQGSAQYRHGAYPEWGIAMGNSTVGSYKETEGAGNLNGWNFSNGGSVTVPASASIGLYRASYSEPVGEIYSVENEPGIIEWTFDIKEYRFEFEVVCMTTKITVVETYRDENVYRLTCTATPQGGTAPYSYVWSSTPNGSQALSATNQATLEVEIPVIGNGYISVTVSDSSNPACTASASFYVCGSIKCDFTTSLISTPPVGATGPYIYECVSKSVGAGDLVHEWSPTPSWVSEDGTVAKFSFPDDDEHSIYLSVKDFSGCYGFKTHKVGGYEFTISTDPGGEDMGTVSGTRDTIQFTVTVTAQATGNFTGTPPSQLTFEFSRPSANEVGTAVAPLVAGSSPPRYELPWAVQQAKGKWQIKVQGYKSNTVTFKINKRKQIVEVAESWVGATPAELGGDGNCNNLTANVYGHVGLPIGGSTQDQYDNATVSCVGDGCLLFYSGINAIPDDVAHVAISSGGQRVNINSNTSTDPQSPVNREDVDAGVGVSADVAFKYKEQIASRSTVNLDED